MFALNNIQFESFLFELVGAIKLQNLTATNLLNYFFWKKSINIPLGDFVHVGRPAVHDLLVYNSKVNLFF